MNQIPEPSQSPHVGASTRKQAFKRALRREVVLPVPYSIKFTVEARESYSRHLGRSFNEIEDFGSYVIASHTNDGWRECRPGYFVDYFGVTWNKTVDRTLGVVDGVLLPEPSLRGFSFPSARELPVYAKIEANTIRYPDRFHMLSIGFALFERAWSLCGMENLMIWMLTEPSFVNDLLDGITEYNIALIRNVASIGGIDCVHLGDDWGSQHGPLVSPEIWREFVKPRFKLTCSEIKSHGLAVSLHCCGNVAALMEDIIDCGVDVFDPFQPEAMDIWELWRLYKNRIAFWGGLSVQSTFPHGSTDDVIREAESLIQGMGAEGGYILAPSHSLTGDVPPSNIDAFIDVAMSQPGH
jgi:uroporphyrinogen decarboxylase